MIAVDTNILVYARREESAHHSRAKHLLRGLAEGPHPWAIPWPCVYEFLRVITHPRVFTEPTPLEPALEDLEGLFDAPSITLIGEGVRHRAQMVRMMTAGRATGNLAHDAHIAALLMEHGVREFWTSDKDFSRFPGVLIRNPLIADELHETQMRYSARRAPRLRTRR